jgi:hypothetical protein
MTLYCDPEVQFGGMKVGGIRISHMSDIDGEEANGADCHAREEGALHGAPADRRATAAARRQEQLEAPGLNSRGRDADPRRAGRHRRRSRQQWRGRAWRRRVARRSQPKLDT